MNRPRPRDVLRRGAGRVVRAAASRAGYQLTAVPTVRGTHGVPQDDTDPPRADHPDLVALRARYAACDLPMAATSWWEDERVRGGVDLTSFRADNLYVWQDRRRSVDPRVRLFVHVTDVAARVGRSRLRRLGEDGAYGAHVQDYATYGPVSRDRVDSAVELDFLLRHVPRLSQPGATVIDVGAGYGRLAHRASELLDGLGRWVCVDAVPESTYLSRHYLGYRGVLSPEGPAEVVAIDELREALEGTVAHAAVNVHSFSEMPRRAVAGWLGWLAELRVPHLVVVPNEPGDPLGLEADGSRPPLLDLFDHAGYHPRLVEPVIVDPDARDIVGVHDRMWLFEREDVRNG